MCTKYIMKPVIFAAALLILLTGAGCNKEKISGRAKEDDLQNAPGSNIRLYNLSGADMSVVINNTVLTSQFAGGIETPTPTLIGRKLFPQGLWKKRAAFTIPTTLLDKSGRAYISIPGYFPGTRLDQQVRITFSDTSLQNDPLVPEDYYLLPSAKLVKFPRNSTPPSNPQNFKLRIVNLGSAESAFGLTGPVTATYADGSPVDRLQHIAPGASSDYVELPYGAYQFKMFAEDGGMVNYQKQLCTEDMQPAFNPCVPAVDLPQQGYMPQVATFKPGGVYTLLVLTGTFVYDNDCTFIKDVRYANIYQTVADLDPGINFSYARMNAVNTIPGRKITISVDGKTMGGPLEYIGETFTARALPAEYHTFVQGEHVVQVKDEGGNVVSESSIRLFPFDNYTVWAHAAADGKIKLVFTANDMTNTRYRTWDDPEDDHTDGDMRRIRFQYVWQSRFMNFCNTQPYITFTNNGQLFLPAFMHPDSLRPFQAYQLMQPGVVPVKNGSIFYFLPNILTYRPDGAPAQHNSEAHLFPRKIWVNAAGNPPALPGSLLTDIAPLTSERTFFANEGMYRPGTLKPPAENGIYTVALVGGAANQPAKLIAIKHNK
ncbi:hypothetical protein [Chitinophaga barathri]|uniref:DUF4397 domain-containing protein n=1 Tax=Chitinophaga barathri TaxID=1647451 RepID=A0A3N4MVH3_9BACT|nr:hypothetical protein [Chitinophaga barathri]RPD39393.1 hypothetical protein EG028_19920 [Chitinophaga barathri]